MHSKDTLLKTLITAVLTRLHKVRAARNKEWFSIYNFLLIWLTTTTKKIMC